MAIFEGWSRKAKLILIAVVAAAIVVVAILVVVLVREGVVFDPAEVSFSVSGPENVKSGEEVSYEFTVSNQSGTVLENPRVEVTYPDGFVYRESTILADDEGRVFFTGSIEAGTDFSFTISGNVSGDDGAIKTVLANFVFGVGEAEYSVSAQSTLRITPADLEIFIEAPREAASGDAINYLIKYSNKSSDRTLERVRFEAEYPVGFVFSSSGPAAARTDNVWDVGNLAPGEAGEIRVNGRITGRPNEAKSISVAGGVVESGIATGDEIFILQVEQEISTRIIDQALVLDQSVNGKDELVAEPGEQLQFSIDFKNGSDAPLPGTVIAVGINIEALDEGSISVGQGGRYSGGVITWTSGSVPELGILSPGEGGELTFNAKVKKDFGIDSVDDKNFFVRSEISGRSSGDEYFGNFVEAKVKTVVEFAAEARYTVDGTQVGSGPLPPQVGQETKYRIYWRVTNTTNDLANLRIEGALPTGVRYLGNEAHSVGGAIVFNPLSEKVVWEVGRLKSGFGILGPAAEASFDVAITPSVNQVDNVVALVRRQVLSALDTFVEEGIEISADDLSTDLEDDPQNPGGGKVQP